MRPSAGAVALQSALGSSGARLLAPGDEHAVRLEVFELLGRRADGEAAVQRDLAWCEPEPREFADGLWQQGVLDRVARQRRRRQDQAACAAFGVRRDFGDLRDVAELGRLAELALANRPGIGIGERRSVIFSPRTRFRICSATFSQRSASSSWVWVRQTRRVAAS